MHLLIACLFNAAGGVSAASMLVSATSSNAILGGQQLAQAADVSLYSPIAISTVKPVAVLAHMCVCAAWLCDLLH